MTRIPIAGLVLAMSLAMMAGGCGGGRSSNTGVSATYHHYFGPSPWRYGRDRIIVVPTPPEPPEFEAVPLPTPEPEIPDFGLEAMPMGFPDE